MRGCYWYFFPGRKPSHVHISSGLHISNETTHFCCSRKTSRFLENLFLTIFARHDGEALQAKNELHIIIETLANSFKKSTAGKSRQKLVWKIIQELISFARVVQALRQKRVAWKNPCRTKWLLYESLPHLVTDNAGFKKWLCLANHCEADFFVGQSSSC